MLIGVQGLITTHVVLHRGSPHSTPKTFCLTGMISYAGGVEWGLSFKKKKFLSPNTVEIVEEHILLEITLKQPNYIMQEQLPFR